MPSSVTTNASACYAPRVKSRTKRTSVSLVASWLAAELAAGKNKTEAVRDLNEACGTKYQLPRINEWLEQSERSAPSKVRRHMLSSALPYVLSSEGLDVGLLAGAKLLRVVDRLS